MDIKGKGKLVLVRAKKSSRGMAPPILNLGTRLRCVVNLTSWRNITHYSPNRRILGSSSGLDGRPGEEINIAAAGDRARYCTSRSLTTALITDVRTSERERETEIEIERENNKSMENVNCVKYYCTYLLTFLLHGAESFFRS